MTHGGDEGQTDRQRIEALEESNALILQELADLTEKLHQATQVEAIIRRAREANLLAIACHSRGAQLDVPAVEPGTAVSGTVHHNRETA